MAQIFGLETLGKITKLNDYTIQLDSSIIQLGGKEYNISSIVLDIRNTGLNGLDTGTIESDTLYGLFAVLNSNQVFLVASKENTPSGYNIFKLLGRFRTGNDSLVNFIVTDYLDNIKNSQLSKTVLSNGLSLSLRDFIDISKINNDQITTESSFFIKQLNQPSAGVSDRFGRSIAIYGDFIAVGSPFGDFGGTDRGEVLIFEKNRGGNDNWGLVTTLRSPNASNQDNFGNSVALYENILVVGARLDDGSGENISNAGEAYVFGPSGLNNWVLIKVLNSPNQSVDDFFGSSVAIYNDYIVVGAPNDDGATEAISNAGEAYVFKKDQGGINNWGLIKTLNSPNESVDDLFGSSVAIYEDYIVIGAPNDDGATEAINNTGEAYVFKKDQDGTDNWGLIKTLNSPNESVGDLFGSSVSIHGDYIVIGAPNDDGATEAINNTGEAYVFKKDQGGMGNWGLIKTLNSPNESVGDLFGSSVAIYKDYIVVGAYFDEGSTEAIFNAGEAYVFKKNQGGMDNWGLIKTLNSSNQSPDDNFGISVAIYDDYIVVGADGDDGLAESTEGAGEAYVFKLNSIPKSSSKALSWSHDNKLLTVAHETSPFISTYEVNNNIFNKLSDPSVLPTGNPNDCKFTNDSRFLAVAHATSPFITIYEKNNLTFNKLSNPVSLPTNTAFSCSWSPNSRFLAVGQLLSPFINIYERVDRAFTRLANPSTLPSGNGRDVGFSPNGKFLAVAHLSFPYLTIYEISNSSFIKIANPPILPTSNLFTLSWSPSGNYLAVAGNFTLVVYKVIGSTFNAIYSINPNDNCNKIFWSIDEKIFGVCLSGTPSIRFYKIDNDLVNPQSTILDSIFGVNGASWSQDNRFLGVVNSFEPYLNIYETSAKKPMVTEKNLKVVSIK
jgi:hypothetical protein